MAEDTQGRGWLWALGGVVVACVVSAVWMVSSWLDEEDEAGEASTFGASESVIDAIGLRTRESSMEGGGVDASKPGNSVFTLDEISTAIDRAAWTQTQRAAFTAQLSYFSTEQWAEWQLIEVGQRVRSTYSDPSSPAYVSESDVLAMISQLP